MTALNTNTHGVHVTENVFVKASRTLCSICLGYDSICSFLRSCIFFASKLDGIERKRKI